jgi:hypothetical protein
MIQDKVLDGPGMKIEMEKDKVIAELGMKRD